MTRQGAILTERETAEVLDRLRRIGQRTRGDLRTQNQVRLATLTITKAGRRARKQEKTTTTNKQHETP